MANFRFFSFDGQHNFTGSQSSFVCALHETYTKIEEKTVQNHSFSDLLLKWPICGSVRLFYCILKGPLKHLEAR